MFVTLHGRSRVQIAPSAEMNAPQDAADGGGVEPGTECDLIAGSMLPAQLDDAVDQFCGCCARTAQRSRGAVVEPVEAQAAVLGVTRKRRAAALRVWPESTNCASCSRLRRVSRAFL
jgi:hypothetical protein